MSESKIKLNNVTELKGLENIDLSGGFICDLETGICGPEEEIKNAQKASVDEEKKNENNNLV